MMLEVKITDDDNNELDLLIQDNDIVLETTGEALITQRLFSQDNWLQPTAGSRFEMVADGIITADTRSNVQAVLNEISQELIGTFSDLKMTAGLKDNSVTVDAVWGDNIVKYK